jgi:hypothetical protein
MSRSATFAVISITLAACGGGTSAPGSSPDASAGGPDAALDTYVPPDPGDTETIDEGAGDGLPSEAADVSPEPPCDGSLCGIPEQIALGDFHSCVRLHQGTVTCWGENTYGELGDGTTTQRRTPTSVAGLADVAEVAAGGDHTCARMNDGIGRSCPFTS